MNYITFEFNCVMLSQNNTVIFVVLKFLTLYVI